MNNLLPSITDQPAADDRSEISLPSASSPLPSPSSRSSPSITSLPPELISEIFRVMLGRSGSESTRHRTPASLCLVNRLFLHLARPVLYRKVYVRLEGSSKHGGSYIDALLWTLVNTPECSKSVRGVRLALGNSSWTFFESFAIGYLLAYVPHVERLEAVRADRTLGLVDLILRHQPRLKSFELPEMKVELHDLFGIFDTLQDLEVYIGQLPGIEDSLLPLPPPRPPRHVTRKLRRVVAAYPVDLSSFSRFILPSQATLTSLTISVTPENQQLDLSPFSNLTDLRLCLGASGLPYGDCFSQVRQQHLEPEERSRANGEVDKFAKNVQRLLRSARSTKSLSVSTSRVDVSLCLQTRHLFDTLPSSIVHFTMIYNILRPGGSNLGGFARALRARSFPHLRSIHVVRYVTDEELEFHDDELKKEDEAMKTTFQGAAEDPTLSVTCRWEQHDRVWSQHSVLHLCDTDEGAEDDADSSGENESEDEEELE